MSQAMLLLFLSLHVVTLHLFLFLLTFYSTYQHSISLPHDLNPHPLSPPHHRHERRAARITGLEGRRRVN